MDHKAKRAKEVADYKDSQQKQTNSRWLNDQQKQFEVQQQQLTRTEQQVTATFGFIQKCIAFL